MDTMNISVVSSKRLKGGKSRITDANGVVYYSETGELPVCGAYKVGFEMVEKDGQDFAVIRTIEAVKVPIAPQGTAVAVTPSLPVTSLPETKAPGGELPVKKAGANVKNVDSDYMSKKDWADKDRRIELTAIFKSTIESPAYQELIIGKNVEESLKTFDSLVEHFLAKLDEVKGR